DHLARHGHRHDVYRHRADRRPGDRPVGRADRRRAGDPGDGRARLRRVALDLDPPRPCAGVAPIALQFDLPLRPNAAIEVSLTDNKADGERWSIFDGWPRNTTGCALSSCADATAAAVGRVKPGDVTAAAAGSISTAAMTGKSPATI